MDEFEALLDNLLAMLESPPEVPALLIVSNEEEILDMQFEEGLQITPGEIEEVMVPTLKSFIAYNYPEYESAAVNIIANNEGILVGAHLTR